MAGYCRQVIVWVRIRDWFRVGDLAPGENLEMSYPKQASVADRLQNKSLDALDDLKAKRWSFMEKLWRSARRDLRTFITDVYHSYFPNMTWSLVGLNTSGAWYVLNSGLKSITDDFRQESLASCKESINLLYRESLLRHAWVLDQTTPPNIKIRIPQKQKLFEARAVAYYRGDEAIQKLGERWNSWSDGYYAALVTNLRLGAMNGSSASDAADEVDATRVNTPAFGIMDAFQRLFDFETAAAINSAVGILGDVNEEADVVQIWETRRDLKVCDDCDANEGLPEEEADGEIPLHPNCVLPGQFVIASDVVAAAKSFYKGWCVEISLSNGARLSVTENHPVLTTEGWVLAKNLRKTYEIIYSSDPERVGFAINPYYDHRPALIEDVFESLNKSSGVMTRIVKSATKDFHGDGEFIKGDIHIVSSKCLLGGYGKTSTTQSPDKLFLDRGDVLMNPFAGICELHQTLCAGGFSSDGVMRRSRDIASFDRTKAAHSQQSSGPAIADIDIQKFKTLSQGAAIDPYLARQFVLRFSGLIAPCNIADVRYFQYEGHVFDLQCREYSLYNCNGVYVKNCNCYWRIVPKSWAALLRSGNAEDYDLAVAMDAHGLVPNAMVIRDESGKLAGYTTVSFDDWVNQNFHAVTAR